MVDDRDRLFTTLTDENERAFSRENSENDRLLRSRFVFRNQGKEHSKQIQKYCYFCQRSVNFRWRRPFISRHISRQRSFRCRQARLGWQLARRETFGPTTLASRQWLSYQLAQTACTKLWILFFFSFPVAHWNWKYLDTSYRRIGEFFVNDFDSSGVCRFSLDWRLTTCSYQLFDLSRRWKKSLYLLFSSFPRCYASSFRHYFIPWVRWSN